MRFGMHLSFKGGPERATALGCKVLQIFCGNPRGWQKSPLDPEFIKEFRAEIAQRGIAPVIVHATYLINLATPDDRIWQLSRDSFISEVQRAAQVGAQFYVLHIGNHGGAGAEEGRRRVADCMLAAVSVAPDGPEILVENTSGGGSSLGGTFEDVAAVMQAAGTPRLGLCLDTCHALAAGYDIRTPRGATDMLDCVERTVGLKRLRCLHINDSKGALGSHIDHHAHIGQGHIGVGGFRAFFGDERLWNLPAVLETPRDEPHDEYNDLWKAIELAVAAGATTMKEAGPKPSARAAAATAHLSLKKRKPVPKPPVGKAPARKKNKRRKA